MTRQVVTLYSVGLYEFQCINTFAFYTLGCLICGKLPPCTMHRINNVSFLKLFPVFKELLKFGNNLIRDVQRKENLILKSLTLKYYIFQSGDVTKFLVDFPQLFYNNNNLLLQIISTSGFFYIAGNNDVSAIVQCNSIPGQAYTSSVSITVKLNSHLSVDTKSEHCRTSVIYLSYLW